MTSEEFLAGAKVEGIKSDAELTAMEWNDYRTSEEGFDELVALVEMDCYDGPTGDA